MLQPRRLPLLSALAFIGGLSLASQSVAGVQLCADSSAPTCGGFCFNGVTCGPVQGTATCECQTAAAALGVTKMAIKLTFSKANSDGISLKATLPLPSGFQPAGKTLLVDVGGAVTDFVLEANYKATQGKSGKAKSSLRVARSHGVPTNEAVLTFTLSKGSIASQLTDEGLDDTTVTKVARTVGVTVTLDGASSSAFVPVLYTAKQGKSGSAKLSK